MSLDKFQLYNRYICQEHFGPDSFMNSEKKKLKPLSVPFNFNSDERPSGSIGKYILNLKGFG